MLGALIGAGIGAGIGVGLGVGLCDGSHCEGYPKDALYFGAIGAAIGGMIGVSIDLSHDRTKRRAAPSLTLAPLVGPTARGGRLELRF